MLLNGKVSINVWHKLTNKEIEWALQHEPEKFTDYGDGTQLFCEHCITNLPTKPVTEFYRHIYKVALADEHNDTKQLMIYRSTYYLRGSDVTKPVTHMGFHVDVGDSSSAVSIGSVTNDGAQKSMWTATGVYTASGAETFDRAYLMDSALAVGGTIVPASCYAEFPNSGSADLGLVLAAADTVTVAWTREFDGSPNASTLAGTELGAELARYFSAGVTSRPLDTIGLSYDAGVTFKTASAVYSAGGGSSDDYIDFVATVPAHGEGTPQTIDRVWAGNNASARTLAEAYGWDPAASEAWAVGESKTVTCRITITDDPSGDRT
jgi:hypothetical protein